MAPSSHVFLLLACSTSARTCCVFPQPGRLLDNTKYQCHPILGLVFAFCTYIISTTFVFNDDERILTGPSGDGSIDIDIDMNSHFSWIELNVSAHEASVKNKSAILSRRIIIFAGGVHTGCYS